MTRRARDAHRLPGDVPIFAEPEPARGDTVTTKRTKAPTTGKYRALDPTRDPAAAARTPEAAGKRGPTPNPDALHAQLADGRGSHLHVVIDSDLHRRLKVRGVMTDRTVSALVAEAIAAYMDAADT